MATALHRTVLSNMRQLVFDQLPRTLQERLTVDIEQDAFQMRVVALLYRKNGAEVWRVTLEPGELEGVPVQHLIPDAELSRLCIEVVG